MSYKGPFTLILAIIICIIGVLYFKGRPPQNHYEALGVTRFATQAEIKTQFRRTALKFHPDKNPDDEEAIKRFHQLVDARDTLMDPVKRREYDIKLDSKDTNTHQQSSQPHQQQHNQQQQRPPDLSSSWNFRTESWNCQNNYCWWFTYIRDTFLQYMSFWGFINIIFFLGVGTFIVDGVLPKMKWFIIYILCHCIWNPLTRTKDVLKEERKKE